MSPLRLSIGKTFRPFRRPPLAAGRGLALTNPPVLNFTRTAEVPMGDGTPVESLDVVLGTAGQPDFRVDPLPEVAIEAEQVRLSAPAFERKSFDEWEAGPGAGEVAPDPGWWSNDQPAADPTLRQLWPLLDPPYMSSGDDERDVASSLRDDQRQAVHALIEGPILLFADDPGTDKAESVCLALASLVQARTVRHALLLTPYNRQLHWLQTFSELAPGLYVGRVEGPRAEAGRLWAEPFQVLLCDYARASEELHRWRTSRDGGYDLVIADSVLSALRRTPQGLQALSSAESPRRWAIAGGMPTQSEDWRMLLHYLVPDEAIAHETSVLEMQERVAPYLLRRTKLSLADSLPVRHRRELWLELDRSQQEAYQSSLAEERHMLGQLGESVSRTHIDSTLGELNRATAFAQGSLDGIKVRALSDLMEAIKASGDKAVVFSQYRHRSLEPLSQAMHAYGALMLPESATEAERGQILASFRRDPNRRLLLAHLDARGDGERLPASHIIHFDIDWNSARRLRAEQRFFPQLKPDVPLTITEFWVAGTHDEGLHDLLEEKGMLPDELPSGTQPIELDERITMQDWLQRVIGTGGERRVAARPVATTTGLLPGTTLLRSTLSGLTDAELEQAVGALMEALGFSDAKRTTPGPEDALALTAKASGTGERVLVWVLRTDGNIGVADGRELLAALKDRGTEQAAYLVTTGDFTSACKKLAEESEGKLALVAGTEFYRHLRILGWF